MSFYATRIENCKISNFKLEGMDGFSYVTKFECLIKFLMKLRLELQNQTLLFE